MRGGEIMNNSLLFNILFFYAILLVVNLPAPFLGLKFDDGAVDKVWFAPPGYVIAIVWWILFTLLGAARYLVVQSVDAPPSGSSLIIGLGVLCAAYAYYTLGLEAVTGISALWFGLAGNLLVIAAATFIVRQLFNTVPTAAFLVAPVVLWTSFATLIVLAEIKAARLIQQ